MVACVQAMTGRAGDDLATYGLATVRDARAALVTILPSWPDLEPDDVRACAEAWTERLRRIRHGGPVDPPTARQLAEALAAWSPERTEAARPVRWMVPAVER